MSKWHLRRVCGRQIVNYYTNCHQMGIIWYAKGAVCPSVRVSATSISYGQRFAIDNLSGMPYAVAENVRKTRLRRSKRPNLKLKTIKPYFVFFRNSFGFFLNVANNF